MVAPRTSIDVITPAPAPATLVEKPYFTSRDALEAYDRIATHRLGAHEFVAVRSRRDRPDLGLTVPNQRSDVLMALVNLRPLRGGDDIWCDGRHQRRSVSPQGGTAILDHRLAWTTIVTEPFDTVHFFLPIPALDEITEELRVPRVETLVCPITDAITDEVMLNLARAILPAFARPDEANRLFADHLFLAVGAHLVGKYGSPALLPDFNRGGLAPWQRRQVTELLLDDISANHSLTELASACGVSTRQFSRAFKASVGTSPHRWLLRKRVERAKELLRCTDQKLGVIALACGFADQAHFTRVFSADVGTSPANWRRKLKI